MYIHNHMLSDTSRSNREAVLKTPVMWSDPQKSII